MRCGKIRHRSHTGAIIALKRMKIASLVAYYCSDCKAWHLGNNRDLSAARIDQLLEQSRNRDAKARRKETMYVTVSPGNFQIALGAGAGLEN